MYVKRCFIFRIYLYVKQNEGKSLVVQKTNFQRILFSLGFKTNHTLNAFRKTKKQGYHS